MPVKRKFKLTQGRHQGPGIRNEVVNFERGAVIESEEPLDVLFPNKFKRVRDEIPGKSDRYPKKPKKGSVTSSSHEFDPMLDEEEEDATADETEGLEHDVSSKFKCGSSYKVFKDKRRGYSVVSVADPTVPLNSQALRKSEVNEFIESLDTGE